MAKRWSRLIMGIACGLALAGPSVGQCGMLLNEVLADPDRDWDGDGSVSSRNDEWVAVVAAESLTADGYFLGDESGGFVYGFSGPLGVGEVQVVYGGEATAWETENGESATGLRLGNTGDTVTLWQVVGADTTLVDSYTFLDHEAENDRSSGRLPDGSGGWALFDGLTPYGGDTVPVGTGLLPTPGTANGEDVPTPTVSLTWGQIKALYDPE